MGLVAIDNDLEITLLVRGGKLGSKRRGRFASIPGSMRTTHHKMRTGATDSKFGFPVWDGLLRKRRLASAGPRDSPSRRLSRARRVPDLRSHTVARTIDVIMEFAGHMHRRWGAIPNVVIPGGGFELPMTHRALTSLSRSGPESRP